jgi:hypothetical protein
MVKRFDVVVVVVVIGYVSFKCFVFVVDGYLPDLVHPLDINPLILPRYICTPPLARRAPSHFLLRIQSP